MIPHSDLKVYANANDADEARRALSFGAEGIGLARTEYMFLNDKKFGENRARTIQSWILSDDEIEKGILPDPNAPVDEMGNPIPEGGGEALPPEGTGEPALGEVAAEPVAPEPPPEPKGGKI